MSFPIHELIEHLYEERDFLITALGNAYEKDELLNMSGRLYELNKIIKKIEEMDGV